MAKPVFCHVGTDACKGKQHLITYEGPLQEHRFCTRHYRVVMNSYRMTTPIRTTKPGYVYFVFTPIDTVKIGYTTTVVRRWLTLSKEFGGAVTPLALVDGDQTDERRIHELLDDHRVYLAFGEQFRPSEEVMAYVQGLPVHPELMTYSQKFTTAPTYSNYTSVQKRVKADYQEFAS